MPLYIKIAVKYLFSLKSKALSFMTIISLIGITVGVSALLVTLSVMSGFQYGLKEKLLETNPHILIMKMGQHFENYEEIANKYLKNFPDVVDYEPFIYINAIASKDSFMTPVIVRGIIPSKDKIIMGVDKKLIAGDYEKLKLDNQVILGRDAALTLNVWVGDSINLLSPFGKKTPIGFVPKIKKVFVAGIVSFGIYEIDSTYVAMNLKSAQSFFDMKNSVTGIQLKIKDPYSADIVKEKLQTLLPADFIIRSWIDLNRSLFQALQLEKLGMFLVLGLIVLVASFNISSLLITKAREKRKDIAIFKTIGADNNFILKTFLWQGMIIGILGTLLGTIIGLTVIHIADYYHLIRLNPEVYLIEYLPLKISNGEIFAVIISSLLICFISSIFPAKAASKEVPAEVLRYE